MVYNPAKVELANLKRAVDAVARTAGWDDSIWFETSEDDPGEGVAREALAAKVDIVLVAGGDGTVRSVASALRATGMPLALIPAGTGNLLARNLELPIGNLHAAISIGFNGTNRAIDVAAMTLTRADGSEEEHIFTVMAGFGIDATMIAKTNPDLKRRVGWLAYVDAGLRSIPDARPFRLQYQLEGQAEHHAHVSTVLVANCGSLPGNVELIPDAEIDDGLLDLALLQPKGMLGWLLIWRKITWENRVLRKSSIGRRMIELTSGKRSSLTYLRGASVRLAAVAGPQEIELDGDEFGMAASATVRAHQGALMVRVRRP